MTEAPGTVKSIVPLAVLGQNDGMRMPHITLALLGVLPVLLAGCAQLSTYYRPGADLAGMQSLLASCQTRAHRLAPVRTIIRDRPDVWVPPRRLCTPPASAPSGAVIGTLIERSCRTEPGYWRDGGSYTVDLNADHRHRIERQCMAAGGYQPVTLPRCAPGISPGAARVTQMPPELTDKSCAVVSNGTLSQIVTP